jgi:hypothetical protein
MLWKPIGLARNRLLYQAMTLGFIQLPMTQAGRLWKLMSIAPDGLKSQVEKPNFGCHRPGFSEGPVHDEAATGP